MNLPENQYSNLTAVYGLFDRLSLHWPRLWIMALGPSLFLFIEFLLPKESREEPQMHLVLIGLTFALTAVFAPLHIYDLSILCASIACLMVLEWRWILVFLPGVLLSARPALIVMGLSLPWTPTSLTIYWGAPWIALFTIIYIVRKK